MTYLVTGATGGLGGYALNYLKELVPKQQDLTSELVIIVMQNQ